MSAPVVGAAWVNGSAWHSAVSSSLFLNLTPLTDQLVQKIPVLPAFNSFQEQHNFSKLDNTAQVRTTKKTT